MRKMDYDIEMVKAPDAHSAWVRGAVNVLLQMHRQGYGETIRKDFCIRADGPPGYYVAMLGHLCKEPVPEELMGYFVPEPEVRKSPEEIMTALANTYKGGGFVTDINDPVFFLQHITDVEWPWHILYEQLTDWIENEPLREDMRNLWPFLGCVAGLISVSLHQADKTLHINQFKISSKIIEPTLGKLNDPVAIALYMFILFERISSRRSEGERQGTIIKFREAKLPLDQKDPLVQAKFVIFRSIDFEAW